MRCPNCGERMIVEKILKSEFHPGAGAVIFVCPCQDDPDTLCTEVVEHYKTAAELGKLLEEEMGFGHGE